jgi:hypothetical protein
VNVFEIPLEHSRQEVGYGWKVVCSTRLNAWQVFLTVAMLGR